MSEIYTYVVPKLHGSREDGKNGLDVSTAMNKASKSSRGEAKLSHVQNLDKMGTPRRPYIYLTNVNLRT